MITLSRLLQINAASCLGFGGLFLLQPTPIAHFLSPETPAPTLLLFILGAGLIAHGLHLLWVANQVDIGRRLVWYFSLGDYLWVLGSLSLLVSGLWITSTPGFVCTLVVAAMVGGLGLLQQLRAPS